MIQNFRSYDTAQLTNTFVTQVDKKDDDGNVITDADGNTVKEDVTVDTQTLAQGPAASQIAIKQLGTNGGGFFNVNSAHPFENPTPLSNFLEMFSILLISAGLTYTLGRMVGSQSHGWAVYGAMMLLFVAGIFVAYWAESRGNPLYPQNVDQAVVGGNFEGKETRFGVANSVLWATATTDASNGSVNSMHDSYTPVGGPVPLANIQLERSFLAASEPACTAFS